MSRFAIPRFRGIHNLSLLIVLVWLLTFTYHERYVPYKSAKSCLWPDLPEQHDSGRTDVLFIADPQLIDRHTYPKRNEILLKLSQHTVDVYIHKNYNSIMNNLKPDYVFFLGDYLDNGRSSTDEYFYNQLERFNKIFLRNDYTINENFFVNVAGNHDIGWADGVKLKAKARFMETFGNPNAIVNINDVDFVTLDSISLSSSVNNIRKESRQFLDENFADADSKRDKPRVLLTHVPLYRDVEVNKCGPLRENPVFHLGGGYQYKLALDQDISLEILKRIKPNIIFSGDDHDYCDINHTEVINDPVTREITVKSISMAMGIKYPGIQLLSFVNRDPENEYAPEFSYDTKLCYLPSPYACIATYVPLAILSGLLVLWWNIKHRSSRYNYSVLPIQSGASTNATKISNFLKEQEEGTSYSTSIPKYTSTSLAASEGYSFKDSLKFKISNFIKKWNIHGFFKQIILLAVLVILLYYIGFCLTL
ncbi:uncharacterized protein AC631_05785 [Debaryomyces fabryi]|uniref:Calcineurin-like phosphoesterase domain-containing protein n=1 Tax=Debaryomyces fabryi TaxID=58627 RepID=A0A0V1PQD4_9ASCO|nr:uncharacterized protein AC631_05785 [Debaryomyces fabryi]KRZ98456.1 hypothetical protein AC631_05785 [Debaryomyces fabryi]CUM47526.1 unnamed protein product [Debaryomyces fabryi]